MTDFGPRPGDPTLAETDQLLQAVAVMDRLRSPGGCPWDAEQTHASLARYLIEESYELLQAIEDGDPRAIREELGDVLLQVLFHARIASEIPAGQGGFDIEQVAGGLVDKLIARHPHVFGTKPVPTDPAAPTDLRDPDAATSSLPVPVTAGDQQRQWDELKRAESGRAHPLAGVPMGQPSLALAGKLGARAAKYGVEVGPPAGDSIAEQIFRLAYRAGAAGEDPETAVRAVARAQAAALDAAHREGEAATG